MNPPVEVSATARCQPRSTSILPISASTAMLDPFRAHSQARARVGHLQGPSALSCKRPDRGRPMRHTLWPRLKRYRGHLRGATGYPRSLWTAIVNDRSRRFTGPTIGLENHFDVTIDDRTSLVSVQ